LKARMEKLEKLNQVVRKFLKHDVNIHGTCRYCIGDPDDLELPTCGDKLIEVLEQLESGEQQKAGEV